MRTSQCDRKRIDDFFRNELPDSDIELTHHLETCAECRLYFDAQAAQPNLWLEAAQMLKPTEFDQAGSAEFSGGGQGCLTTQATPSIQAVLDSLVPSEHPERLGRLETYEISGVVGAGGMGVVLKAFDPSLDRVVAAKVLAPHLANSGSARKRFSREAKAAAAVLHPNVIPIHSVSSDAPLPFLVMAYVRGGSLQNRLDREGPLPAIEILRIGSQIAAGLAAAHDQGLIHRDIKPENILLEEGVERVTLTDFGLARAVDDTSVTREGTIAGTPQYMSPEQARGETVDQTSDLFSLGSVLYTLCTGSPPFKAETSYGVMRKITDEQPKAILELNSDIPAWLARVVGKLMAKNKASRFKSAAEVRDLLETCLSHMQQPASAKLPAWLAQKEKSPFTREALAGSLLRPWGLFSMLTIVSAVILAVFLFPGDSDSPLTPDQQDSESSAKGEVLGNGYVRKGDFIYFDGQRIDQAGEEDIDRFAKFTELELSLAEDVDAASFMALSEEYTKDKNKVYYKWISPGRFWVVQLPQADVKSFEVLGFNFAKDSKRVWWYGKPLPDIDPASVEIVNEGFVWKDANSVWYQHETIPGADAATFRHLGQAFYRDKSRVYWSGTPLSEADPDTFRTFGDDSPYGADRKNVWKAANRVVGLDAASFEAIHQSVYKDRNGVYASGYPVGNADPKTFRKVVDLDEHFTALLADDDHYYIFLPYRGEVYQVALTGDSLTVSRQIWAPGTPQHRVDGVGPVAISTAKLEPTGWQEQSVVLDGGSDANQMTRDQEAHLLNIYRPQFIKAKQILREGVKQEPTVMRELSKDVPARRDLGSKEWRTNVAAFEKYLGGLSAAGRVPDKPALAQRVTLIPGGRQPNSEVVPVTDGAGGFIDTRPAEDTVQFRVNEALKGKKVSWEFELRRDATEAYTGVVCLIPKIADDDEAVPVLGSLFIKPSAREKSSYEFKAGDLLKLEGTIGDFATNNGITALQSPSGPVAIYHLDSASRTVFWLGLSDVTITSPTGKTTPPRLQPDADISSLAKELLRASFRYDEQSLKAIYASEVRLLPGNRLFQYGLELPGKMTSFGVVVERDKILPALRKQADRNPVPESLVTAFVNLFRIEQLDVPAGEFATDPNQPGESVFEKVRFTIGDKDVLLIVSMPGAFRYLQLRKLGEQWKVVAEY